jgi:hypothetical protein
VLDIDPGSLGLAAWLTNAAVVACTLGLLFLLTRPRVRGSSAWRATSTPLASIIGSGFLIVAPLLGFTVGRWALAAMAAIVALAYAVGSAIRYNIAHVEDITEGEDPEDGIGDALRWLARAAKGVLAGAYVIAITFYLELLGAFVLRAFGTQDPHAQKIIATALIAFIGIVGLVKGLEKLESMEIYAVETKLSIIGALLLALALYNGRLAATGDWSLPDLSTRWSVDTIRKVLGAFLIVQGFETSHYLRGVYPPDQRIRTMRWAQLGTAAIYVAFIALATVLLDTFDSVSETGIITLSDRVAFTLPILLVIGAITSQFSAAVADTIGSGGLVEEATRSRVPRQVAYAGVAVLALLVLWSTDIFSVVAYASRAFALYYAIQCLMAALHAATRSGTGGRLRAVGFATLAVLMVITAAFGIPAESQS